MRINPVFSSVKKMRRASPTGAVTKVGPESPVATGTVARSDCPEDGAGVADQTLVELLGFMLSDEEYALDILEIKEIIRYQDITMVPRVPGYIRGIMTLRGVIVPIFDLRRRLGLTAVDPGPDTAGSSDGMTAKNSLKS